MTATVETFAMALTAEQACTVHAALVAAAGKARTEQLRFLDLHESPSAGPVTRAEAWQAFKAWEKRESDCAQACEQLQQAGYVPDFSAFNRFG